MGEKKELKKVTTASMGVAGTAPGGSYANVVNVRVTYRNAPIHLLEKFSFKDVDAAHEQFLKSGYKECVILQTCNRVEVYAAANGASGASIAGEWAKATNISEADFAAVEIDTGRDAVVHLMKLAAGLDSLVVGEDQILGQVRRAFEYSKGKNFVGSNLSVAFDRALKVGSLIRTTTGINKGNVSVASVAVNLAEEYFDDLEARNVLLVGTGEAASFVAKLLKRRGVKFAVTSRAPERAKSFAETVAGEPIPFDSALENLSSVDIIFTATKAPYRLITFDRIESAMKEREKGMMIFDLSNPRTVDERVTSIHGVKLVNMDQIAELVGKNMRSRMKEVRSAERMIRGEIKAVDSRIKRMRAEPTVVSIFKSVDTIRDREVRKAVSLLGKRIGPDEARILEQLSHAIVEGVLAAPMNNLRKEIETTDNEEMIRLAARLFKYEERQERQTE